MATKREELTDPRSCLSKAGEDEPLFVLRAKDRCAPGTVRDWAQRARCSGEHEPQKVEEAMQAASKMEAWRREQGLA